MKQFSNSIFALHEVLDLKRAYLINTFSSYIPSFKLLCFLLTSAFTNFLTAQSSSYSMAGKGSGTGGSFTNNIGEVAFLQAKGSGGTATSGVLIPKEFYRVNLDEQIIKTPVNIYPNCVSSELNISFSGEQAESYTISLVDISGKEVYSIKSIEKELTIDMSLYMNGLYFIQILRQDHSIFHTSKFIKM